MELTPSQVSGATFRTVKKGGYDPSEVESFLTAAAKALEDAQQQATAMEARARAAVARLQEVTAAAQQQPEPREDRDETPKVSVEEAETISRTLLLAQRTADTTTATARAEADRILNEARAEAETTIDSTREMSAKLLEQARGEARKASAAERQAVENEVRSLVGRRELLVGDVDQLERFLIDQRERLRSAAREIEELCERVPDGLGGIRRPRLTADDAAGDETVEMLRPPGAPYLSDDPVASRGELATALDEAESNARDDEADPRPPDGPQDVAPATGQRPQGAFRPL